MGTGGSILIRSVGLTIRPDDDRYQVLSKETEEIKRESDG